MNLVKGRNFGKQLLVSETRGPATLLHRGDFIEIRNIGERKGNGRKCTGAREISKKTLTLNEKPQPS